MNFKYVYILHFLNQILLKRAQCNIARCKFSRSNIYTPRLPPWLEVNLVLPPENNIGSPLKHQKINHMQEGTSRGNYLFALLAKKHLLLVGIKKIHDSRKMYAPPD